MRRPFFLLLVFALTCFATTTVAEANDFGRRESSSNREERRSERRNERRAKEKRDSRVRRVEERSSQSKNRGGFGRRDPERRRDERVVIVRPARPRHHDHHHHHPHPRPHWGWWAAPSAYYVGWGVYPYGYYAYGYHPYWGAPRAEEVDEVEVEDEQVEQTPKRQESPRSTTFSLFGGAHLNPVAPSLVGDLQIDGRRFGLNVRGATLGSLGRFGDLDLMPMGSAHLTYSFVSTPHMRLRVHGGVSAINAPDFVYVGPDLGASGQIALFGPLALYGRASWTPLPATILDTEGGVALQFGGLGVRAGWKRISLSDTWVNPDGGTATFSGPTVQAGLVF